MNESFVRGIVGIRDQVHGSGRPASWWAMPHKYDEWRQTAPTLVEPLAAAGVRVRNCTRGSRMDGFPYVPLDAALAELAA